MKKWTLTKILSLTFLLCLLLGVCVACTDKNQEYYGTYTGGSDTVIINKDFVSINGTNYNYVVEDTSLNIDGFTKGLTFYEDFNVLSFNVILEFDSGSITERNKNFSATLYDYGNGGIQNVYMFKEDGSVQYVNGDAPTLNAYGSYCIKNGVIRIMTTKLVSFDTSTVYWYVAENGQIHHDVYIKNADAYFNADNTSDNEDDGFENDDNTVDMYTITYHLNGGSLMGAKNSFTINDLPYELPYAQGTEEQCFVKWTTDEAGLNEIESITEVGDYTLYAHYENSSNFLKYKYDEELQGYVVSEFTGNGKTVTIPPTYRGVPVKGLGWGAFGDGGITSNKKHRVKSITISTNIQSISSGAFRSVDGYNYGGLENFYYAGTLENWCEIDFGCAIPAQNFFIDGKKITNIVLPNTTNEIKAYTFSGFHDLTSIEIPDGVTSIGMAAFSNCSSLTGIEIPDSVTIIGMAAFSGCGSLTNIEIPDGVTSIGYNAFYNCSSLTEIKIPNGVTNIGEGMFSGCSSLKKIKISESVTSISSMAFENCALETLFIDSNQVANMNGVGELLQYATDVYIRADITVTASIYNVLFNNLGKETLDGVEYYHYQIKGE